MMTVETNRNNYIWDKIDCLLFGTFGQICVYRMRITGYTCLTVSDS